MHQAERRAARGAEHLRIAGQCGDVIDDLRPGVERGSGHGGLGGVNADGHPGTPGELAYHVLSAAPFLDRVDRSCIRARRLAADVEDVRPFLRQLQAVRDGVVGTAVGERVGCCIHDAHDQRAALRQLAARELPGAARRRRLDVCRPPHQLPGLLTQGLALERIRQAARGQPDLRDAAEHERSSRSLQDRKAGLAHAFGQHAFGEERRPPAQVRICHLAPDRRAGLPRVGFALELEESHRLDSTGRGS